MPDEQGRRIRDKLKLKPCYIVARKGRIKFDSRFDPYNQDFSCAEFIAHVFSLGGHKLIDESEYFKLNWFYRILAYLVGLDISPVLISPQQIIDSDKLF